jgi:hypothetical protein
MISLSMPFFSRYQSGICNKSKEHVKYKIEFSSSMKFQKAVLRGVALIWPKRGKMLLSI